MAAANRLGPIPRPPTRRGSFPRMEDKCTFQPPPLEDKPRSQADVSNSVSAPMSRSRLRFRSICSGRSCSPPPADGGSINRIAEKGIHTWRISPSSERLPRRSFNWWSGRFRMRAANGRRRPSPVNRTGAIWCHGVLVWLATSTCC